MGTDPDGMKNDLRLWHDPQLGWHCPGQKLTGSEGWSLHKLSGVGITWW